jgi:hypothetical protein
MNRPILPRPFRKGGAGRQFPQGTAALIFRKARNATGPRALFRRPRTPLTPELRGQFRGRCDAASSSFFAAVSRRSIRVRTRRHFLCSKGREERHACSSSRKATSSALRPWRAIIVAASASISARGMRRGRMLPSQDTHRSAPQIGLVAAPMAIHINACLTVSMRQRAITGFPDYLKNRYSPCRFSTEESVLS